MRKYFRNNNLNLSATILHEPIFTSWMCKYIRIGCANISALKCRANSCSILSSFAPVWTYLLRDIQCRNVVSIAKQCAPSCNGFEPYDRCESPAWKIQHPEIDVQDIRRYQHRYSIGLQLMVHRGLQSHKLFLNNIKKNNFLLFLVSL